MILTVECCDNHKYLALIVAFVSLLSLVSTAATVPHVTSEGFLLYEILT